MFPLMLKCFIVNDIQQIKLQRQRNGAYDKLYPEWMANLNISPHFTNCSNLSQANMNWTRALLLLGHDLICDTSLVRETINILHTCFRTTWISLAIEFATKSELNRTHTTGLKCNIDTRVIRWSKCRFSSLLCFAYKRHNSQKNWEESVWLLHSSESIAVNGLPALTNSHAWIVKKNTKS